MIIIKTILNKCFLFISLIICIIYLFSCTSTQKSISSSEQKVITGEVTLEYWKANAGWALYEAFDYEPEPEEIEKMKSLLEGKNYSFVIFATTYCDECMENLPKLFKVFETAQIPNDKIHLIGLDEKLSETSGEYKKYNISTTPVVFLKIDSVVIGEAGYPYRWSKNFIEILEGYYQN